MTTQRDPVSKHVAKQLSDDTRRQIEAHDGSKSPRTKLAQALVGDLNKVVEEVSLYDEKRFAGVDMPDDLAKATGRKSTGNDLPRLNVMLHEAAYPNKLLHNLLRYSKVAVERVQTGVRIEKRMLKVLKALAEYRDASLGELLEDMVLHAFLGYSTFAGEKSQAHIAALKEVYAWTTTSTPECAWRSRPRADRLQPVQKGTSAAGEGCDMMTATSSPDRSNAS